MKSSPGESCAPLGITTGPVKPSLPWPHYHTLAGCGCQQQRITQGGSTAPMLGWNLAPPLGRGLWRETQPLTGVTGPWWSSAQILFQAGPWAPFPINGSPRHPFTDNPHLALSLTREPPWLQPHRSPPLERQSETQACLKVSPRLPRPHPHMNRPIFISFHQRVSKIILLCFVASITCFQRNH